MQAQGITRAELDLDREPFIRCSRCNGWNQDAPHVPTCRTCAREAWEAQFSALDPSDRAIEARLRSLA